eukprot:CAMPEP_0116132434 /NCGR_PEP_ID=MMETSP0329-20121206/9544_1 /TAXON_ID=697910 /ORGANISM="Pseudo-nitzschia arenysensis, Strain B593" /LENGTH=153 /DNA_ID=CAMNT_0003626945 /DNA_START=122 /DNA_END=583 /DNA_ORIENTATION=-
MAKNNDGDSNGRRVKFSSVQTREYPMTIGANPAVKIGCPICLSWEYYELPEKPLPDKKRNKKPREFYLNYYQRVAIAERAGFSKEDAEKAEKKANWGRTKRKLSFYQCYPYIYVQKFRNQYARGVTKRFIKKYRKEHGLKGGKKRRRSHYSGE